MIDTDKYEGHIAGPWVYEEDSPHGVGKWEATVLIPFPCNDTKEYPNGRPHPVLSAVHHGYHLTRPDLKLIADSPILLAEVIRLRSYIAHNNGDEYRQCPECGSIDFDFKFNHKELECKCDNCDNTWKELIE